MRPERVQLLIRYCCQGAISEVSYAIVGFLIQQNLIDTAIDTVEIIKERGAISEKAFTFEYLYTNLAESIRSGKYGKIKYQLSNSQMIAFFQACEERYCFEIISEIAYASRILIDKYAEVNSKKFEKCLKSLCQTGISENIQLFFSLLFSKRQCISETKMDELLRFYCSEMECLHFPTYLDDCCEQEKGHSWLKSVAQNTYPIVEQIFIQDKYCGSMVTSLIRDWIDTDNWISFENYLSIAINNSDEHPHNPYQAVCKPSNSPKT